MKKSIFYLMLLMITLVVTPGYATNVTDPVIAENKELPARVQTLLLRVNEIKAMDKSSLSREEKKELRKELRSINTELKSTGNGVYLSIGAIIIIILLLILIL